MIRTRRLKIGAAIYNQYNPTTFELELLSIVEDELNPEEGNSNGNGPDMDTECEG